MPSSFEEVAVFSSDLVFRGGTGGAEFMLDSERKRENRCRSTTLFDQSLERLLRLSREWHGPRVYINRSIGNYSSLSTSTVTFP